MSLLQTCSNVVATSWSFARHHQRERERERERGRERECSKTSIWKIIHSSLEAMPKTSANRSFHYQNSIIILPYPQIHTHSTFYPSIYSHIYSSIHSSIYPFTYSSIQSSIHPCTHPCIIHPCIIHLCIYAFTHPVTHEGQL